MPIDMQALRDAARKTREDNPKPKTIHLFRGSPAVRRWSKHQETTTEWSLCGIHWSKNQERSASEDSSVVNCEFCLQLIA